VPYEENNLNADIMLVGRDPGEDEVKLLRPFVGKAGKELDDVLVTVGLFRNNLYIANLSCCRPYKNIAPKVSEASICADLYLRRAIAEVKPKVIVTLGKEAMNYLLGNDRSIGGMRGIAWNYDNETIVIPTWHPSYLIRLKTMEQTRYPEARKQMENDFKKAIQMLL
jgi:DNA polymerase